MSIWGTLGTIAGGGLGALLGGPAGALAGAGIGGQIFGAGDQNQANWDNARAAEAFSERMSNTAHQREVTDLRAAGLNPILSANAGASSPNGVNAQAENTMGGLAQSAFELATLKQNMEKGKAEIGLLKANKAKAYADERLSNTQEEVTRRGIPEAELKNDAYDLIRPWVKKLKDATQSNSPNPKANKELNRWIDNSRK